jgi:oligoendopeptidase F
MHDRSVGKDRLFITMVVYSHLIAAATQVPSRLRAQSANFQPFPPGTEQLYHFDLSRTLFASPDVERTERTVALALAARAAELAPTASSSAKSLLAMLRTADSAELQLGRHYAYLTLLPEVDRRNTDANSEYAALAGTAQQSLGRVNAVLAALDDKRLQSLVREQPALAKYSFAVTRAHVVAPRGDGDPRTSEWLQTIFAGPQRFAAVNRAIDWGEVPSPEGPLEIRTKMGYILAHPDRSVREAGFRRNTAALATRRDTFADIITSVAKARNELSRSRGFSDYREESYGQGALSVHTIHEILTALREASLENRKIERLRKAIIQQKFGYAEVHWWDLMAPLPGQPVPQFRFDEATRIALDAAKPIGSMYVAELGALLDPRNGRIDVAPAPFKSAKPGFATGTVGYPSHFFMSRYNGLVGDLSILVHEAGHAAQDMMMDRAGVLPRYAMGPSYFTESYATLSQFLLLEHLARSSPDTALKIFYLERLLDQGADLYKNAFEAMLEDSIYVLVGAGRKPGANEIERLHQGIASQFSDWYGPGSDITLGWVQPLQFYTWPLYRINYVLANLLALNYLHQLESDPKGFQRRYQSLLSRGYDARPSDLLRQEMGIDVNDHHKLIATAVGELRQWRDELASITKSPTRP